jgi:hypothetical protein
MTQTDFRRTVNEYADFVEISSFPHHRHLGNKIEFSEERNLDDVLEFIRKFMG